MEQERQEIINRLNLHVRDLCKNITRKEIIAIAKQHGWEIMPAGKERLKACRKGYPSISISGHNDSSVIPLGTAFSVVKSLLKPTIEREIKANAIASLQRDRDLQKNRADRAENQLAETNQILIQLKADIEAAFDLAVETEHQNGKMNQELHRYSCWIQGLKQKIASLVRQKAQQDEEMLAIANAVEQQELHVQSSATKLTEFSRKLQPKLQRELKQIIKHLREKNIQ